MDRRKFNRKQLKFFSRVMDQDTGMLFGYLADLTPEGAMIIGDKPLATDAFFNLRMDLPEVFAPNEELTFKAQVIWSRPDDEPDYFRAGLRLLNINKVDLKVLEYMLDHYSTLE